MLINFTVTLYTCLCS